MIQRGQQFSLALKPGKLVRVCREHVREILTATSRFSRVSRARYTSPIPPAPINDRIS
jgi:hypothetical protein